MNELDTGARNDERLIDLAREHVRIFGDEEIDLVDFGVDIADPVELARRLEEIEETIALARKVQGALKEALAAELRGGAVRIGNVVYVEGAGSGRWKPTRKAFEWLVEDTFSNEDGEDVVEVLARHLDDIVSGIRVTAFDAIAKESGLDPDTVRDTFLSFHHGRRGIQRRDLSIQQVSETARKWWPKTDGEIVRKEVSE